MFHLALTFGLESDPLGGLARMVGFVERTGREHGVDESVWMTVGVSDGESIWAVRYASDGKAPTLYHSRDVEDLARLNPESAREDRRGRAGGRLRAHRQVRPALGRGAAELFGAHPRGRNRAHALFTRCLRRLFSSN